MTVPGALWIGIDVGTQSVKASVLDGAGIRHAAASASLHSVRESRPDGDRHEQNPREWVNATRQVLSEVMRQIAIGDRALVSGIAVCATSGSLAVVDGNGHPLGAGIMYDDARAGALADEVRDAAPELWRRLGYRIQPTWALPKIVWLDRNTPDGRPDGVEPAAPRHIAHQADVVAGSLVGRRVASDWSHSLKSGYDLTGECWPVEALARLGLDPARLPDVVAPGTVLGHTDELLAGETGVPARTPVYAGMTDGCAAQLGAAAIALGDWHTVIGTTMVMKTVSADLVSDDAGAVYSHRSPEPGLWFPGGASNVGAGILADLFPGADLAALTAEVAERYDDLGVAELPFGYPLPAIGERFPLVAPTARGFVVAGGREYPIDLAVSQLGPSETLAAIMVGVACVERLALEQLARSGSAVSGTVSSSGGGSRNPWWVQLRSDLLGREITVSSTADGSTGMAILAAWAAQRPSESHPAPAESLAQIGSAMSHSDTTYRPDAQRTLQLQNVYARFIHTLTEKGWIAE